MRHRIHAGTVISVLQVLLPILGGHNSQIHRIFWVEGTHKDHWVCLLSNWPVLPQGKIHSTKSQDQLINFSIYAKLISHPYSVQYSVMCWEGITEFHTCIHSPETRNHLLWHWLIYKKLHSTDSQTVEEFYRYLNLHFCTFSFKFRRAIVYKRLILLGSTSHYSGGWICKTRGAAWGRAVMQSHFCQQKLRKIGVMRGHDNFTGWWKRDEKKCCYPSKAVIFITL